MNKDFSNQLFPLTVANSKYYLLLFILWPFLALLVALANYSQKEAKKVVYIFLIYYGLTFVIANLGGDVGVDSGTYAMRLRQNAELPFSDFFKMVGGLYTSETTVDIYEPIISFIVSRFTSQHNILFAVYAAIFGFFYLISINLLYNRYRIRPGRNAMIFMVFFVIIIPITAINGVRMYTAAWIFFYGAYHVILDRNPRYLLLAMASSLVHFSFFSANVVLIIYFLAGNRNLIYLPIAIVSFVLPQLIAPLFQSISLKLGGALQNRYNNYSSEGYVIVRQEDLEQSVWFMRIGNDLVFYYLLLTIVVIQLTSGNQMKEKYERNLFSFLLLFLSFVNFGASIPSFGGRFQILFFLFATLYVFLFFVKLPGNKVNLLTWIGLFPMILYAAITFRVGSDSINAWILAPGLGLPLLVPGLSIADFLFN